ncbi:MAG: cytochrome-c oxidase, cbb3-type subunit I [Solirubrobacteraceae bacterium]
METQKFYYDNKIVRAFIIAAIAWGTLGMMMGLIVATLLFYPELPEKLFGKDGMVSLQGLTGYGRIRMIHTNLVIFGLVANTAFFGIYYSMQRVLKARLWSDKLSWIHFWGWQFILLLTGITYAMGINTSKEYAEHEWPVDILIALIWVVFGINMFATIAARRINHMYVAVWFYIATFLGVGMLHIFNSLAIPISLTKSYSVYAGVQDAMVQWWYGHNAVAFLLTTPILGLMYYFIPKISNRPIFSYKLSIIHFWSLIFVYIWAGPHHLLYTSLPGWAQALGTSFSIMLIAPSWGGMLNGLLTLRGAWDKVREEPVLKFLVVALTTYGMATFDGPMLATKSLNQIGHFTDWVIAHVHVGALGWNGFMAFGIIYYLVPKIYQTKLYSKSLAEAHFYIATFGILLYVIPMYFAGFTQAQLWKQWNMNDGSLYYSNFLQTVTEIIPFYIFRAIGGSLYLIGAFLMIINVVATMRQGSFLANEYAEAPPRKYYGKRGKNESYHTWLERKPVQLSIFSFIVIAIGGSVEILPTLIVKDNIPTITAVKPYSPLEVEGRDLYIREGCNACHSQMVRPFRDEVERFGEYSKPGEFVYDHPFLWGSKRTGPDLHREGGKNPNSWHYKHMYEPRSTSPGSIMPRYPWLIENKLNTDLTKAKLEGLRKVGVPYTDDEIAKADVSMETQAKGIVAAIYKEANDVKVALDEQKLEKKGSFIPLEKREIVALISYLQRLGTDIKSADIKAALN